MEKPNKEYDSVVAAKYMLALAVEQGRILNATQLQKLLYIAYGFCLTRTDCRIVEERVRAWPYGPVFPKVQKKVGLGTVYKTSQEEFQEIREDKFVTDLFKQTINDFSKYTAGQLSAWSHEKGSPWDITTTNNGGNWNLVIEDELIKDYFADFDVQ